MDRDDDGETSYNTFVDDVALEPTYLQALPTAAGRNVATQGLGLALGLQLRIGFGFRRNHSWSSTFTPIGVTIASAY